jgi:hypothetical protein
MSRVVPELSALQLEPLLLVEKIIPFSPTATAEVVFSAAIGTSCAE